MDQWPNTDTFTTHEPNIGLRPKREISVRASGELTIAINPALGFQVKLTWLGKRLVNQDIRLNFQTDYTFSVTAQKGGKSTCDGLLIGADLLYGLTIDMSDPLPGWKGTDIHHTVVAPRSVRLAETQCKKWETPEFDPTVGDGRRAAGAKHLFSRVDVEDDAFFPDTAGASPRCLEDFNTPTGDCQDRTADDNEDEEEGEALVKRDLNGGTDKGKFTICDRASKVFVKGLGFPSSGDMTKATGKYKDAKFETWGPEDKTDRDDYSFERSEKPPPEDSHYYESEHVLEWQTLTGFLEHMGDTKDTQGRRPRLAKSPFKDWRIKNPLSPEALKTRGYPQDEEIGFCDYLSVWWWKRKIEYKDYTMGAIDHLRLAIPNTDFYTDELQLLWKGANGIKQRYADAALPSRTKANAGDSSLWQADKKYQIRKPEKMEAYLRGDKVNRKQRDVNDAINVLRDLMFAVRYVSCLMACMAVQTRLIPLQQMARPEVKRVMFAQADWIYKRL